MGAESGTELRWKHTGVPRTEAASRALHAPDAGNHADSGTELRWKHTVTELSHERWDNGDQGRDDERDVDSIKEALIPVTGVVHLDCTQGEHRYLYKNVRACMELE
jgi:hypothetical protein